MPVLDLRAKLGLPTIPTTEMTRILVLEVEVAGRVLVLGLVADRVFEVLAFAATDIEPAPDIGVRWRSRLHPRRWPPRRPLRHHLRPAGRLFSTEDAIAIANAPQSAQAVA